jgi:hypothetical protein
MSKGAAIPAGTCAYRDRARQALRCLGAQERRAGLAAGAAPRPDLLGVLLGARDDAGAPMTDEELWEVQAPAAATSHATSHAPLSSSSILQRPASLAAQTCWSPRRARVMTNSATGSVLAVVPGACMCRPA